MSVPEIKIQTFTPNLCQFIKSHPKSRFNCHRLNYVQQKSKNVVTGVKYNYQPEKGVK